MGKEDFIKCEVCERDKRKTEYYVSSNPNHIKGCITICKKCATNMIDMNSVETLKNFLKRVDRPFILSLYESAIESKRKNKVGAYFTNIGMSQARGLGWEDSEGIEEALKESYDGMFKSKDEIKREKRQEQKSELQLELEELNMTEDELEERKAFWGDGYTPTEYNNFQRKYDSLIDNYNHKSSFVIEGLQTYCVYKCKAEMETARGNIADAKEWSKLAITQADKAKINLSQLSKSDLSQGVDSFSEVAILVEKHLDIIPILPKFIEKPNDPIDVAILSFINYNRRMKGMEDAEHSEVYDFYQKKLKEFKESDATSEDIKKNIIEIEITTESGRKKKILFYDVYKVIEQRKKEHPNDKFVQNLDKWMELISYLRFFPDVFYQMMEKKEGGSIKLDSDQKLILRVFARFPFNYTVFPRGYGKTLKNVMSMYHACILYPNLTYAMTAQTRESSAKLINSKIFEIEDSYPMLKKEVKDYRSQKEDTEIHFLSGGIISNLANNRNSLGLRRHKLMIEEYAQIDEELLVEVILPIIDIPRRTIGRESVMSPYENNGGISFITTSYFVNTPPYYKGLEMMEKMINLEGAINIGANYELPLAYGRGAPRSAIMQKKSEIPPLNFSQNYESIWVGVTSNALVDISKVMNLRTLTRAELSGKKGAEYIIAVDVARSEDDSNNRCCATVVKIVRSKVGKITKLQLVNILDIPATKNFRAQAQDIMKLRVKYDAKRVVIDANGLGVGLVDELLQEQVDPSTGESLGCWATMNTEQESEDPYAPEYVYALKSQATNHDIIINFINMVEGGKLQLLEKRIDNSYELNDIDHIQKEVLPFASTDSLLEELANLKLKEVSNGKMSVVRQTRSIDKDKFSSLSYNLFFISEYEDNYTKAQEGDMSDFLLIN